MDLFKYTFDKISTLSASDDNILFPIGVAAPAKHNGRKGSYVTPNRFSGNYTTQFKLSITSSPNFRYKLDYECLLNLNQEEKLKFLDNNQADLGPLPEINSKSFPRVWPSFGYFGGAREVFVEFDESSQLKLSRSYKFKIPGRRDFYRSDDDEEVKSELIRNIQTNIRFFLGQQDIQNGNVSGKIKQSEGIAINIEGYLNCNVNITASIAYKDLHNDSFVKCWLTVWNDDSEKWIRNVYFTEDAEYFFSGLSVKYLASLEKFTVNVFSPLYDVLMNSQNSGQCFQKPLFYLNLPP